MLFQKDITCIRKNKEIYFHDWCISYLRFISSYIIPLWSLCNIWVMPSWSWWPVHNPGDNPDDVDGGPGGSNQAPDCGTIRILSFKQMFWISSWRSPWRGMSSLPVTVFLLLASSFLFFTNVFSFSSNDVDGPGDDDCVCDDDDDDRAAGSAGSSWWYSSTDLEIVVDPGSPTPSDNLGWQKRFAWFYAFM